MSDAQDYYDEQQRQQEEQRRQQEELRRLYELILKRQPTPKEYGLDREAKTEGDLGLKIAGQHQKELATGKQTVKGQDAFNQYQAGLTDPKRREEFRRMLRQFAGQSDAGGQFAGMNLTPDQWRQVSTLEQLNEVPVSFLNPSLKVRREDVDTPEEASRYLQKHGGDTQLNRQLLRAAIDYGGLSIEPTPFGTLSRPGKGRQWQRSGEEGTFESQLGGRSNLSPQELSAIAQERQGAFRLEDPNYIQDMVAKAALAGIFSYAGGALAGPLVGGLTGSALAGSAAGGAAGGGISGAIGSGGDPDAVWKGALGGGLTGGLAAGIPGGGPAVNALKGAGIGGATNAVSQGLGDQGFDWGKLVQALATGAGTGAASGLGGGFPGADILTKLGAGAGTALFGASQADPLADANQQLDQNAVERERTQAEAMQAAQEEWKRRYAEAQAEAMRGWEEKAGAAQAAQLEAYRAAQQEWEAKKGEYQSKLQAFLAERQDQIQEALRAMGLAEPGIAGLLADRQKEIDAARAEEEKQTAELVESRNFFPSQLLDQTGGGGDFAQSSLLVPHSPPPVMFGQENLPASFGDYASASTPQFSSEGFLPSGSLPTQQSPAVAPMGQSRPPRYFPTLLNGLTRSPYLRYA